MHNRQRGTAQCATRKRSCVLFVVVVLHFRIAWLVYTNGSILSPQQSARRQRDPEISFCLLVCLFVKRAHGLRTYDSLLNRKWSCLHERVPGSKEHATRRSAKRMDAREGVTKQGASVETEYPFFFFPPFKWLHVTEDVQSSHAIESNLLAPQRSRLSACDTFYLQKKCTNVQLLFLLLAKVRGDSGGWH